MRPLRMSDVAVRKTTTHRYLVYLNIFYSLDCYLGREESGLSIGLGNQISNSMCQSKLIFQYESTLQFVHNLYQQMIKQTKPFVHYSIKNFLSPQLHKKLTDIYDHLQFLQKHSDLFHFFQTNELNKEASLGFFRKELSKQFQQLTPMKDTSYSMFASYYFKGNHLLCHDDVVEDRKFAFSYYLEDYNSGQLVLYNDEATSAEKKIKVKKNLLVIFEVSNISYHEVALAKQDGRKAVTGWLNQKGWGATRPTKATLPYQPYIPSRNLIQFPFPVDLSEDDYYTFPEIDYQFNLNAQRFTGPLYERKAWRLQLEQSAVMKLKGYTLFSADFFKYMKGDYMLLNDPVNEIEGQVLDVFILSMPKGTIEGDLITILKADGQVQGHIPYTTETMFIIHRGSKKYFIDLVLKQIQIAHLIYKKNQPKGKKSLKASTNEPKQVKTTKKKEAKKNVKKEVKKDKVVMKKKQVTKELKKEVKKEKTPKRKLIKRRVASHRK